MEIQTKETAERWAPPWWAVFLGGLLLWGATIAVARVTHNIILLPTIVLLGSFLVPITAVVWYLDHDPSPALSPRRIVTAFLIGGVMGVLGGPGRNGRLWFRCAGEQRLCPGVALRRAGEPADPLAELGHLHRAGAWCAGARWSRAVVRAPRRRDLCRRPSRPPSSHLGNPGNLPPGVHAPWGIRLDKQH